ncbi:MAG TPA: SRPBCC family protein [Actinophytocola sp.]|jgi:uncharacterized protein YndB with AHSA1/START domain|uniref:SRPBCC family protein n=1 Tax=Actinophytocola sp. TaxID=1872138 RepID=UPI002F95390F
MPSFDDRVRSAAPPEDVWKLLYDPSRFPDWWAGVGTVERSDVDAGAYTMYPAGYPDFPMPQQLRSDRAGGSVAVSCLVSDLTFEWRLHPLDGGRATEIAVHVEIPESDAHRLAGQRELIHRSLRALAELAGSRG